MAVEKLVLDLTLVLPHVPDEWDSCVERLISLLKSENIDRAHVVREDGRARLCLHYDPERIGLADVRQLVTTAGALIDKRYVHESLRIEGMDCPTCATVIEHALGRDEYAWETTVGEERARNVRVHEGISESDFVAMRTKRDATLAAPLLLLPSIQVNIRPGHFPPAEADGVHYRKVPIQLAV